MSGVPTRRVIVADDQALVREGFARVIGSQPDFEVVGIAVDGRDAVEQSARLFPDLVVMDVRMPRLDGISATAEILRASEQPPQVLVVTTFNLDSYVYDALRAGASGFLLKDAQPEALLQALRTVAKGDALIDPAATRALIGAFGDRIRPAFTDDGMLSALTAREYEALTLLAEGLSNAEIAESMTVGSETAKTYVSRVLLKLGLRDRVQAVVFAHRAGIAGR
ncbi:response regulator transcription factor [Microbacterium sp.]|uniref:response regulator n=1 Tax=Microbacterium sp. TaxID=51671 RepID=UPI002616C01E|nr:response regulator transcription factor [Microbacterium sp.]